jgi:hypothetical protein
MLALEERGFISEVVRLVQGLDDHVQGLLEPIVALLSRDAKASELMRLITTAEPQLQSAMGETVHHSGLLCDTDRVVLEGEHDHAGAQAHPRGLARRGGGHEQAIWHQRVAGEVMFGEPAAPVAQCLHQPHLFEELLIACLAR